jgi:hypothetical protein
VAKLLLSVKGDCDGEEGKEGIEITSEDDADAWPGRWPVLL